MDEDNFAGMQEEAVRRVREMQRRAESYVNKPTDEIPPAPPPDNTPNEPPKKSGSLSSLFDFAGIKLDEEKAMIAMLIYILYKNGADIKLLMALGYLLL